MIVVRAVNERDLDDVFALAMQVGPGMTTLKADRRALGERLEIACASFSEQNSLAERDYLFVMEDVSAKRLVGICAIKGAVGLDEPFYSYRIGTLVHSSTKLKVFSRLDTLYLSHDLTGCAELCSLYLHPEYRSGGNGKLLSKSRFLFIAQFPHLFSEKVFAEMRGFQHADGSSPFWDSLGRHFFKMDFHLADDLCSAGKKAFIAELMPRHPLYASYLSREAQDAIGKTHVDTAPARRLLEQEGMYYEGYVDIFDGGPVLQARVSELRALRESALAIVEPAQSADADSDTVLISNTSMSDFRVAAAPAQPKLDRIALSTELQDMLARETGDPVRTMLMNVKKGVYA
ncbi:arginine N-succinyltransferase [Undibacterium sp.]|jgi:arginine N-succinyltransferase|uniref:arginine N-succinyltransferase n=1 Tax=Undibacterium sp. TaxID=1914977 RepID=UPI002C8AAC48|nr:arginine N-succinyltransferase [Undibacterium sp.]HTD06296.1 arginine N-succinyltransferase [Undibacterium sp.]